LEVVADEEINTKVCGIAEARYQLASALEYFPLDVSRLGSKTSGAIKYTKTVPKTVKKMLNVML
jgi:hypothetical protein